MATKTPNEALNNLLRDYNGLIVMLTQMITKYAIKEPTWSDVGSLEHIRDALLAVIVFDRCGAGESEKDVKKAILAEILKKAKLQKRREDTLKKLVKALR